MAAAPRPGFDIFGLLRCGVGVLRAACVGSGVQWVPPRRQSWLMVFRDEWAFFIHLTVACCQKEGITLSARTAVGLIMRMLHTVSM
jgi:hypothetical protein